MSRRASYDDLGELGSCRQCGAAVRKAYVDELHWHLDIDVEPVPSASLEPDAVAWHWRGRLGYFATRVAGRNPDELTYVAHPCGIQPRRGVRRMTDPFGSAAPPGASGPPMADLEGRLLLVSVHSIERGIVTASGTSDGVRADIVDLATGDAHRDAMLWGKVLVGQFTAGVKYVGRVEKGQAQPGKSAPWVWTDGDENDKATAVRYMTHAASQSVSSQAAPASAAATASAPAPAAAAAAPPWA